MCILPIFQFSPSEKCFLRRQIFRKAALCRNKKVLFFVKLPAESDNTLRNFSRKFQPISYGYSLSWHLNMVFSSLNILSRVAWMRITVRIFSEENCRKYLRSTKTPSQLLRSFWRCLMHKMPRDWLRKSCAKWLQERLAVFTGLIKTCSKRCSCSVVNDNVYRYSKRIL